MPINGQSSKHSNPLNDAGSEKHATGEDVEYSPTRIGVFIANVAPLLVEVVEAIVQQQPDMEYVGSQQGNLDTLLMIDNKTDVLLLGTEKGDTMPGIASHLLAEFPQLRIITLSYEMTEGAMYWTGIYRRQVNAVSAESLMNSIRQLYNMDEL